AHRAVVARGYPRRVIERSYRAILLDLDGTLVDDHEGVHPRTRAALAAAVERGVFVMIATGRSELATRPVLEDLGLCTPALVYNGAGLWCPQRREFLEERVLSDRTLQRAVDYGLARGLLTVSMGAGLKRAIAPRTLVEELALREMHGLEFVLGREDLVGRRSIRVTLFSGEHADSAVFEAEVSAALGGPVYTTHFPLRVLPHHRDSTLDVVDIHPPCRGKAEALRWLREEHGIPAQQVVAVGDASNDVPMLRAAGLGVAVEGGMREALEAADRRVDGPHTDALGALVEELFGLPRG
ncbi:MAG TPA: HAD family hydrolase, partial [Planctomycetota bacterium]|nr:HAD family hydrolase [Planctomycetota bacterium]